MKEEKYPSLHFYTWGTVIFVLLVYKFYAPINANSAANFSALMRLVVSQRRYRQMVTWCSIGF